jgi:hypothetical protein
MLARIGLTEVPATEPIHCDDFKDDERVMYCFITQQFNPLACFFTKIFSTHCFRRTSGCASIGAILNRLSAGHGQNPIGTGGSSF